ncbi:S8 family serine peptidase [Methylobacterium sp. C25]|uniref:S8 family peptidase n=1 Tax=Methylobacterium sp. C25 TaxID=2721622 RepID=UPI001F3050FE|nr:S8 family serine peptidase [Methylobacterium sp. C25]MCE4222369.1 S8 family serine peptidase [Methylobacterium sp. C25]
MVWAAACAFLLLAPLPAFAQYRGITGGGYGGRGYGGGYGAGGMGLGIGGAILGGVVGSMGRGRTRDEVEEVEEVDQPPPPRRPRRTAEPPQRQYPIPERPKRVVEKPPRHRPPTTMRNPPRPAEPPMRVAKPAHPTPSRPTPPRVAGKVPPQRPPAPILPAAQRPVAVAQADEPGTVPGEVLIELKSGAPANTLARLGRQQRLETIASESFTLVPLTLHRLRIRDGRSVASVVRALQADPQVASAQPNHAYALVADAPAALPFASAQWVVSKLHLDEAHRAATGRGVSIALIDSGVDSGHPALAGAMAESWDALTKAAMPTDGADPHGTAVAGILGARAQLASAAPEARLVAIRAFVGAQAKKPGAQGTTIHVLRAVDHAASAQARVVNMSFAGPADAKLSQFLAAGSEKGFVYIAAVGNAGPDSPPLYPAADPNVIAVTATDAQDKLYPAANRGPHVSVAAPGVDVFVAAPGGAYGFLTGTSMAAPQVAGIAAMMLEAKPALTLATLREALTRSARDLGSAGRDPDYGAGSADARDALEAVGVHFEAPVAMDAKPPLGAARIEMGPPHDTAKAEPPATPEPSKVEPAMDDAPRTAVAPSTEPSPASASTKDGAADR